MFTLFQHAIATDWIAAYKRYFNTDGPLRDYATSPLTGHDGDLLLSELEELGLSTPADRYDGPTLVAMLRAARHGTDLSVFRRSTADGSCERCQNDN